MSAHCPRCLREMPHWRPIIDPVIIASTGNTHIRKCECGFTEQRDTRGRGKRRLEKVLDDVYHVFEGNEKVGYVYRDRMQWAYMVTRHGGRVTKRGTFAACKEEALK